MFGVLCWLKMCTMASLLTLVLKCGCSKSCDLAASGTRLWPWDLLLCSGRGETDETLVLTRWFLSIPRCSWHSKALKATQWDTGGHTMRHRRPACLLPKQPPPTSSRKVTSWLVSWLAGQEPSMGKKWPQATGQLCWARGVIQLHLEGQIKIVSGWILPHLWPTSGEIMTAFRHFEKSHAQICKLYLVGSSMGPRVLKFATSTLGLQLSQSVLSTAELTQLKKNETNEAY